MLFKGRTLAVIGAVLGAWLGAVAWDYAQNQGPAASTAGAAVAKAGKAGAGVVATVEGVPITSEELDRDLVVRLNQLEDEMYGVRQEHLEAMIGSRLLASEAKRRGLAVEALIKQEVDAKIKPVTDEEIAQFYQANRDSIRVDEAGAKPRIRAYLEEQRRDERREAFIGSLRKTAAVSVQLERPASRRVSLETAGAPAKGPAAAKVTIVEFSDFHCPYCRGVQPTLNELLAKYGDRVRLVFRHFPVDTLHPAARRASEAAWCAQQQDKFWQYHDRLYLVGNDATPVTLARIATDVGLDASKFSACTAGKDAPAAVEQDIDQARRLNLNGTPTFFINGRPFIGRQPIENFTRVIDEELAHAQ
jgi:protein-disulfide isomerase